MNKPVEIRVTTFAPLLITFYSLPGTTETLYPWTQNLISFYFT